MLLAHRNHQGVGHETGNENWAQVVRQSYLILSTEIPVLIESMLNSMVTLNLTIEKTMIFMCAYRVDRDKQADTQAFFANMTEEQIAGEHPAGVTQIGRWHDIPNGNGWIVVESDNQEALTSWIMGWSGQATFPTVTPVVDDGTARKLVKAMLASQQG